MARTDIDIDAPPNAVFAVLSDARTYGDWVVGSSSIRDIDDHWPAAGSRFHHSVGWGPLKLRDHTRVEESRPPHLLVLRARARPLGTAIVRLELEAQGLQTHVVMLEDAGDRLTALVFNPLTHALVRRRNVESLRRLKAQVEGYGPSAEESARP